jgi:hypothetical protein
VESARPLLRRCAIYTRKSSEEGLEQDFNSCTPSARRARRSSRAKRAKAGVLSGQLTMMVVCRARPWSARRSSACSSISARG